MRRTWSCMAGVSAVVVVVVLWSSGRGQGPRGLSGGRAVIDAAEYPSLQAAIDALPETGGVVRLPPGEFEISQPLVIGRSDVLLQGSGPATHIKNINQQGEPALVVRSPQRETNPRASLWRVQLTDFRLTGNEHSGHGIAAYNINEIFIHGVTVSYHGGHGILLDHCYEDPRICNCLMTYNKASGVELLGCHDIVVSGNQFEENLDALRCLDGYNLCMTGNCLDDHLRHGVVIENTYGSVVSGNMLEECRGTAIILDRDCYGIALAANVIAHHFGGGIDLRDAHGCGVSANTFTIVRQFALRIGPDSGRITVTGNNFSDSFVGQEKKIRSAADQAAAGLVLDGTADVSISGNVFSGLSTKAVELLNDPQRVVMAANVLRDAASDHDALTGGIVTDNLHTRP
jgi:hypothetical protein